MAVDARFFQLFEGVTLGLLAEKTGAQFMGDASHSVKGAAALDMASASEIGFFENRKYRTQLQASQALACFVHPDYADLVPKHTIALLHDEPYAGFAMALAILYPSAVTSPLPLMQDRLIDDSAVIHPSVHLAPQVMVGAGAEIGEGTIIGHGTVIGAGVQIGKNCIIGEHCSITHAIIGDGVVLFAGCRIGQDGFGYAKSSKLGLIKVPQLGRVMIGHGVHVGANSCIDRGSMKDTIIGGGCKIDNLVQIGHNVDLGAYCIVVSQVGIAGSTKIGAGSILGGQVGIAGHLNIGKGVQIAAQSGIMADIADGEVVGGSPAIPIRQWHKQNIAVAKLVKGKAKA